MRERDDHWKFHKGDDVQAYSCGLKAGDKVRLVKSLVVKNSRGKSVGRFPQGEIWTVLEGCSKCAKVVWFRQPNGELHTWDDDPTIFDTFEVVKDTRSKPRRIKR